MARYLIERTYSVDADAVPAVATRSKAIAHYHYPEIIWEHSHVVFGADGTPKSFCVYEAPDEATVREHANRLGDHVVTTIYEVVGDVTPDDFPLIADPS